MKLLTVADEYMREYLTIEVDRRITEKEHPEIPLQLNLYLSVQNDDLKRAREVQSMILAGNATDPKLTHSGQNGEFETQKQEGPAA